MQAELRNNAEKQGNFPSKPVRRSEEKGQGDEIVENWEQLVEGESPAENTGDKQDGF